MPSEFIESAAALESYVDAYFAAANLLKARNHKHEQVKQPEAACGTKGKEHPEFLGFARTDTPAGAVDSELENLKFLHWRIDAEVLRLYNLKPEHERMLLDYFNGERRVGVPFVQTHYFPPAFKGAYTLRELLAITADWPQLEAEHERLVEKEYRGKITSAEAVRLDELQRLADLQSDLVAPWPVAEAEAALGRSKRAGVVEH